MLLPIRVPGHAARPVGESTYMGPCVTVGDRFAWEPLPKVPRSIGEITYCGPCLRPEDLQGK